MEEKKGRENEAPSFADRFDMIIRSGSTRLTLGGRAYQVVCIIGQIEGHTLSESSQKVTKYEHLLPLLAMLEASEEIEGVLFLLNTLGGDVEAGLAIAELIASMKKKTVSLVLGGGHSIGIPLAVAAKTSMIVPSATMTLHPVRTGGMVITAPQAFDYLIRMQDRILDFLSSHSRADREDLHERMMRTDQMANDIGSVLSGEDAVSCGLIDRVGGLKEALSALNEE